MLSSELSTKEPKGLHILDDPIVMYRDPLTKQAIAFSDKCPHRSAPLSVGRIMDGKLECRYHGWQFDAGSGNVTKIPSNPTSKKIPANAYVRKYPTKETDGLVWVSYPIYIFNMWLSEFNVLKIWPGNVEDSVNAPEPKVYHASGGPSKPRFGYVDLDIDHCLLVENFLDPAHVSLQIAPCNNNNNNNNNNNTQSFHLRTIQLSAKDLTQLQ